MASSTSAAANYSSISSDTQGLRFLQQLLPALDSLEPDNQPISKFTNKSSRFLVGNSENVTDAETLQMMFKSRAGMLEEFHHRVTNAWEVPAGPKCTTVIFESASVTVIKGDKEKNKIVVKEVSILELEESEGGVEGLVIKEMRSYLDPKPVMEAMQSHADVRIVKDGN